VPVGVFVKIMYGHKAWLGEHNINGTELALIAVTSFAYSMRDTNEAFGPTLRSHARIEEITDDIGGMADEHSEGHTDSDEHSEAADEATDVKDIDIDEEVAAHDDEAAPIDEHDFEDGLRRDVEATELRVGLPEYTVRESDVNRFMLFLPEHWRRQGTLDTFEPWTLIFLDVVYINLEAKQGKRSWLVVYDVATGGLRIRAVKHKYEIATQWDQIIVEESLHKRKDVRVTVGADGDGVMSLIKEVSRKRGVAYLPIPPYSYVLNMVEGAVNYLKVGVASILLSACTTDGPLTVRDVNAAAEHLCFIHERFVKARVSDNYRGVRQDLRSPWFLNTGLEAQVHKLVPWGTPGYAYVPKALRQARGTPIYRRTEPVLCYGYQHMYTYVYKCLTAHNTIIHSEQVDWIMDAPLGQLLESTDLTKKGGKPTSSRLAIDDVRVDSARSAERGVGGGTLVELPKAKKAPKEMHPEGACAILKLNESRFFKKNGDVRPKAYVADRVKALDNTPLDEAVGKMFADADGKMRPYRKADLDYDISCGWLIVAVDGHSAGATDGICSVAETLKDLADGARADSRSIMLTSAWGHGLFTVGEAAESEQHAFMAAVVTQGLSANLGAKGVRELVVNAQAYMAMRDIPWQKWLGTMHRDAILVAYKTEWDALLSTVLRELEVGDAEHAKAVKYATGGRCLLEFKRVGCFKVRTVVQGFKENKLYLDGPDYDYAANVCELAAVRNLLFEPRESPYNSDGTARLSDDDEVIATCDVATAYLQADMFKPTDPARYLKVYDPVLGVWRYFRQLGNLYGSSSAGKRWEKTLVAWLTSKGVDFVQGKNEKSAFFCATRVLRLLTYSDDLFVRGRRKHVRWFFEVLGARFKIKAPVYLDKDSIIDHLGMNIFEGQDGVYLTMQSYIEVMTEKLGIDVTKGKSCKLPMSDDVTDMEPCTKDEAKQFMSATGMVGWLTATGRPDGRVYHSRCSQFMAAPTKGALKAIMRIARYFADNKELCLFQPWGTDDVYWRMYSDSDQSSCTDPANKRRSRLSFMATKRSTPIMWGSKTTKTSMGPNLDGFGVSHEGLDKPTCHPDMSELHADISSAAAEIFAASVALNELLHLGYVTSELGLAYPQPILLEVDNATAITFSKDQVRRSKLRHIDCRQAWVEALRDERIVKLIKVDTTENLADLNSKLLNVVRFEYLVNKIMVRKELPTPKAAASMNP